MPMPKLTGKKKLLLGGSAGLLAGAAAGLHLWNRAAAARRREAIRRGLINLGITAGILGGMGYLGYRWVKSVDEEPPGSTQDEIRKLRKDLRAATAFGPFSHLIF